MADYSDRKTEAELINLEKKLNRLYRRAWNEMRLETEEYFEQFSERYQREYEKYKAGQYTEQQFKAWYQAQVARGKMWEAKRDTLAMQMTHTNEIAAAYINGTTPSIYALNANYAAYMTEQKYDVSFTLVNEDVIQNLVTEKSNAIEFKTMSVNPVRDYKWNSKQIQSALISGILQGKSIDKLADAFMVVQKRNRNAAVRNARTSVTSAQNAGRIDTMKRSRAMGINTKKEWLSAHDGRVRDSHAALNGQIRDIDEAFDNGLMYPADPDGIPAEVYNCRCTLKYVYPKYQNVQSNEAYSESKAEGETYQEWLKRKKEEVNRDVSGEFMDELQIKQANKKGTQYLQGAYEKHRTLNNLNASPISELGENIVGVNYGKISPAVAKSYNKALNKLTNEYDSTLQKVRVMTKDEYLFKRNAFAYVTHNYEVDSSEMVINPIKNKDKENLVARIIEKSNDGWAAKINPKYADEYVVTHEFAHTLISTRDPLNNSRNWLNADYDKVRRVRSELDKVYNDYIDELANLEVKRKNVELKALIDPNMKEAEWKQIGEETKRIQDEIDAIKVSAYSKENTDEFMAECFVTAKLGGNESKYVSKVMEIVDREFKR